MRRSTRRSRCCGRWTRCRAPRSGRCGCSATTRPRRVFTTVGPEQEYFLIDQQYYFERPDLINTGRTLFGAKPPKGHELDDHYFGSIPERVLAYMMDCELELARLGVPVKTRHNEVAPGQYEIAPVFENSNVGSDHQQLTMQVLQRVARRYGLVCLLHEKPFAGVNGSGKHNNWSMGTNTGHNLIDPGETPADNINFLFFCAAVIKAVDKHQGLLRASVANIGQDHRLGANEAPPAIISIFLGAELEKVFDAIASGEGDPHTPASVLGLGTPVLPPLPMHGGDRNRTSPFAFTGNKFEFRALGSSMSLAFPNTVLNTIVAEAIDDLADQLESELSSGGGDLAEAVNAVVKIAYTDAKRVIFGGDNYSDDWHAEAERRGLKNLRTTPDALPEVLSDQTVHAFEKYEVLSHRELESRFEVWAEQYTTIANIEAETAATMARTMLLPAALRHIALIDAAGMDVARRRDPRDRGRVRGRDLRAGGGEPVPRRRRGPRPRDLRSRQPAHGAGPRPRAGRPAREGGGRRPLAAAEVLARSCSSSRPLRFGCAEEPASAGSSFGNGDGALSCMRTVLNIIWLILSGLWLAIGYAFAGLIMCILIITIPFGIQAFKLAGYRALAVRPHRRQAPDAGAGSVIGNILWLLLAGWWLAIAHIVSGVLLAITIIGIPLASPT